MIRVAILAIALTAPALADQNIGGTVVDCYCTDTSGARVELGESICLHVGGRMFTAQCQMSLNVPMWRETSDGCLSSQIQISKPPADARLIDS
ncbi:hypothetical protein [Lentibacter sp. XHP0401]|jgi:hypothetical protein|uniref:hypothetical protein n=1 Tax=Lentibacter sp. XHP0401 TaxID=2984334 RepID=UPI0021E90E4F|nr:hypothetical protein [Lentibacter sp. XHP0401]MCV2891715.1 hypothetical protein [Lentibacter sp. XHP0401]